MRRPQLQLLSVVVALLLAGWLVVDGGSRPWAPVRSSGVEGGSAAVSPEVSLLQRWPGGRTSSAPGRLPDGTVFTPELFVDAAVSFGVAVTADGTALRFMRRSADGAVQEVRRVPFTVMTVGVSSVAVRGGVVWWSTGDQEEAQWHAVDLRTLQP